MARRRKPDWYWTFRRLWEVTYHTTDRNNGITQIFVTTGRDFADAAKDAYALTKGLKDVTITSLRQLDEPNGVRVRIDLNA